jgi:hypothetical protein
VPDHVTIVPLPAKCSELNPQVSVWQFMRDDAFPILETTTRSSPHLGVRLHSSDGEAA